MSPLPLQRPVTLSPRRKGSVIVSAKHTIFISPLKSNVIPHSPLPMSYSFNRSPSKDLPTMELKWLNAQLHTSQDRPN